jgi:hypothetical protein
MLGRFSSHVRHNVVAYVALFVALSGSAYAASTLPPNSVGTKQLNNHAVTKAKLARGLTVPTGPTGPAGGALSGSYPNPTIAASAVGTGNLQVLPGASIVSSANQTIGSGVTSTVAFRSSAYDTDHMFDATKHGLVIHTPGKYLIQASIALAYTGAAGSIRELFIKDDGVVVAADTQDATVTPSDVSTQTTSVIVPLHANDTITAAVFNGTGTNATVEAVFAGKVFSPRLQAEWLGP